VGEAECEDVEVIDGKRAAELLKELDSSPDFFDLTPEGDDLDAQETLIRCNRCGLPVRGSFCTNENCPFFQHEQGCSKGWVNHPLESKEDVCTCVRVNAVWLLADIEERPKRSALAQFLHQEDRSEE
jgi:hypothetical protein